MGMAQPMDEVYGRWSVLGVLCGGFLVTAINVTLTNVALPSIARDLGLSDGSLVWIVNAYLCAFGAFLLVGGRLGDAFGHAPVFLVGTFLFAIASLACGLAQSGPLLVAARLSQGMAAAVVSASARTLVVGLFTEAPQRARALGIVATVGACGGSIGVLLGGVLLSALSWRWIFFVPALVASGVCILSRTAFRFGARWELAQRLDVPGALVAVLALLGATYAIVIGGRRGWNSAQFISLAGVSIVLLLLFLVVEVKARTPLLPLALLRIRNVAGANIAGALLAGAILAWSFVTTLYLQNVLHLTPLQCGLAFLPANLLIAAMSISVAPTLAARFGTRSPLVVGLLSTCLGLLILARAPENASVLRDVIPGMVFVGLGTGIAYNLLTLAAFSGVPATDSGAASGIANTSFTMGGVLGLSSLASFAATRTQEVLDSAGAPAVALTAGYSGALSIAAGAVGLAAVVGGIFLRREQQ